MKKSVIILIFLAALGYAALAWDIFSTSWTDDGVKWRVGISEQDLANDPPWSPEKGEPPVLPGQAYRMVKPMLPQPPPNEQQWGLDEISLRGDNAGRKWFYMIDFSRSVQGANGNFQHHSRRFAVTMSGKVINQKPDNDNL